MPLFGDERVLERLKIIMPYSFRENPYPGVPLFSLHAIDNAPFTVNHLEITPIRLMHHKLPVLGFRIGNFAYLTDFNAIEPKELSKLEGCTTLVVDALRAAEHISHNSLKQALEVIKQIKPQAAYLIHMSHDMGLYEEIENNIPDNVHFSYDQLVVETD